MAVATWTDQEIVDVLRGYDPSLFAQWYNILNGWGWPAECPLSCPAQLRHALIGQAQFQDVQEAWIAFRTILPVTEHRQLIRPLMSWLQAQSTSMEISQDWWENHLHRSREEWQVWWDSEGP